MRTKLTNNFTQVPNYIIDAQLPPVEFMILVYLYRCHVDHTHSIASLVSATNLTRNTVVKVFHKLKENSVLQYHSTVLINGGKCHTYKFIETMAKSYIESILQSENDYSEKLTIVTNHSEDHSEDHSEKFTTNNTGTNTGNNKNIKTINKPRKSETDFEDNLNALKQLGSSQPGRQAVSVEVIKTSIQPDSSAVEGRQVKKLSTGGYCSVPKVRLDTPEEIYQRNMEKVKKLQV